MAKADGKHFDDQYDDEEVLFLFRKHPVVMRKGLLLSSFFLLLGPLVTLGLSYARPENPPSLGFFYLSLLGSFALSALMFLPWWISWYYSVFIVTDQRMMQITQKGLFSRSVVDMALPQIQMVNYEIDGLQATMLGYGTIMMQTFVGDLVIHEVHKPAHIQKKLTQILRDQGIISGSNPTQRMRQNDQEEEEEED